MWIYSNNQLVADIGSKAMLLKHIKRLCKEQGKNYKGFSKMPIKQLKAIYYKLSTVQAPETLDKNFQSATIEL
jgi:hypothetical protein